MADKDKRPPLQKPPETGHAKTGTPSERRLMRQSIARRKASRPDIGHTDPEFDPTVGGPDIADPKDPTLIGHTGKVPERSPYAELHHPQQIPHPVDDTQNRPGQFIDRNHFIAQGASDILDWINSLYGEPHSTDTITNATHVEDPNKNKPLINTPLFDPFKGKPLINVPVGRPPSGPVINVPMPGLPTGGLISDPIPEKPPS